MSEYFVLEEIGREALIKRVNEFISKGWAPLGGVCMFPKGNTVVIYAQALIKTEKEPAMPSA